MAAGPVLDGLCPVLRLIDDVELALYAVQSNRLRQCEWFGRVVCGELLPGVPDPVFVRFHEFTYISRFGSFGDDDLDATPWKNLYGQAFCSATLTHRKARLMVGLVRV